MMINYNFGFVEIKINIDTVATYDLKEFHYSYVLE